MKVQKIEKTTKKRRRRIGEMTKEIREFKNSKSDNQRLDFEFRMYENSFKINKNKCV